MQQLVNSITNSNTFAFSAVLQGDDHLDIRFNRDFDEEDFECLTQLVLAQLAQVTILEKIPGADRHNVRFRAQVAQEYGYFIVNFEVYSQSCWLEAESDGEQVLLPFICQALLATPS